MKKIIFIIFIFIITGCNYTELNDISIIKSIALNKINNEYILYAQIIDNINKDNIPKEKTIEVKKDKIDDTFNELVILSNKEIHYSHIDLLIISNNLENKDLLDLFKYFINNKDFRNDFSVISSNDIKTLLENSNYDEIEQLLENNHYKNIINNNIEDLIKKALDNKTYTISCFDYENDIITYKYNINRGPNEKQ